jgi:hypothetical protein
MPEEELEPAAFRAVRKLPKLNSYFITVIEKGPHTQESQPRPKETQASPSTVESSFWIQKGLTECQQWTSSFEKSKW